MKNKFFSNIAYKNWYFCFILLNLSVGASAVLLPLYVVSDRVKGDIISVGIILAANSLAAMLGSILWGILSDIAGLRKNILLIGIIGSGISFGMLAASSAFSTIIWWFSLFGFFQSAASVVSILIIMDSVSRNKWEENIGGLQQLTSFGQVLGMLAGGFSVFVGGYDGVFIILGVLALAAFPIAKTKIIEMGEISKKIHFKLINTLDWIGLTAEHIFIGPAKSHHISAKSLKDLVGSFDFSKFLLSWFFLNVGSSVFYTPLPIFLYATGKISSSQVFLIFALGYGVGLLFFSWSARLAQMIGDKKSLIYAIVARAVIAAILAVIALIAFKVYFVYLIVILFICFVAAWSIISIAATTLAPQIYLSGKTSSALGIFNSVSSIGSVVGSLLGGWAAGKFGFPFYFFLTFLVFVIGFYVMYNVSPSKDYALGLKFEDKEKTEENS